MMDGSEVGAIIIASSVPVVWAKRNVREKLVKPTPK
jgi:hypothetical protein